ncbi:uncharacterized protein LOC144051971 [Vanacampus margaritifer]
MRFRSDLQTPKSPKTCQQIILSTCQVSSLTLEPLIFLAHSSPAVCPSRPSSPSSSTHPEKKLNFEQPPMPCNTGPANQKVSFNDSERIFSLAATPCCVPE